MTAEQITRNDGGRPYLRMLSTNTHTAQKCIQELNTCTEISTIEQTRYSSLSPFKWLPFTLDPQAYHNLLGGLLIKTDKKRKGKIDTLVLQLCSKDQFGPSIFKKTNLVPQLLVLGQICPCTNVMLHNTMRLMLKSHHYSWLFPLLHNLHVLAVVQQVNQICV